MRRLFLIALFGLGAPGWAQEVATASQPAADVDEVIVPGRRPENLRVEIERLEVAVYDRWNSLNSNDEFDIHCLESEPTGSNITVRTCAPKFVIEAESRATSDAMRGRSRVDSQRGEAALVMEQKSRELTEEMQRVAREDEQLLRDLVRLDELKQLQANERRSAR
jgi:hypothetical protein